MIRRFFHAIFDHWIAKLVCIVLAFGLWVFVVNTGYRQGFVAKPIAVTARDVPVGLALATPLPSVQVEIYAPTAAFQRVKPEDIQAFVNLAGLTAGEHTVEIKAFADDPNVRILNVSPTLATISLEKVRTKIFDVKLETEGDLGQGYVGDKAEIEPSQVSVRGAASLLDAIDQVVVRLPLNGETSTVTRTVQPQALDADRSEIAGLTFDPGEVKVSLPVIQAEDAKKVGIEVQTKGDPAAGFFVGTITADPSTTTLQGTSKALKNISTVKTEPIDLSGATANLEQTVKLVLPSNVRAEPSSITVKIQIKSGTLSQDFSVVPEVFNLASGTSGRVAPSSLTITLSGPSSEIRDIEAAGLHLRIDAQSRAAGDYVVTLSRDQLGIPSDVRASFSIGQVTLHIE